MNTSKTYQFVTENEIIPLKADVDEGGAEVDQLLKELGNPAKGIPYYAIFPANGRDPIILKSTLITQNQVLDALQRAASSSEEGTVTAMNSQARK